MKRVKTIVFCVALMAVCGFSAAAQTQSADGKAKINSRLLGKWSSSGAASTSVEFREDAVLIDDDYSGGNLDVFNRDAERYEWKVALYYDDDISASARAGNRWWNSEATAHFYLLSADVLLFIIDSKHTQYGDDTIEEDSEQTVFLMSRYSN
jgi:hypothetical protein